MGGEKTQLPVGDLLKNALQWKQWMADDLRLLIRMKRDDQLDEDALRELTTHHLKTYDLVNQLFSFVTGDNTEDGYLFDLPNVEYLLEVLPTLDVSEGDVDKMIEPMLELELDGLSQELRDASTQEDAEDDMSNNDDQEPTQDLNDEETGDVDIESSEEKQDTIDEDDDAHFVDDVSIVNEDDDEEDKNSDIDNDNSVEESEGTSEDFSSEDFGVDFERQDDGDVSSEEPNESEESEVTTDALISKVWGSVDELSLAPKANKHKGDVDQDGE